MQHGCFYLSMHMQIADLVTRKAHPFSRVCLHLQLCILGSLLALAAVYTAQYIE